MSKLRHIPALILMGSMLVSCSNSPIGSDKEEEPSINKSPIKPHSPYPGRGETIRIIEPVLTWECSDPEGDSLTYDIYFGLLREERLLRGNHPKKSFGPVILQRGHIYNWWIVAEDEHGNVRSSDTWKFKVL